MVFERLKRLAEVVLLCLGIVPQRYQECGVNTGYAGERIDDMDGALMSIAVDKVVIRDNWNVRESFPEEDIRGLQFSMEDVGILNPIIVKNRPDGRYDLIAGEKRFHAAKLMKTVAIPARVYDDLSAENELRIMLDENLVGKELNVIEEARAFARLAEFRTVDEIASRYRRSTTYVRERLDLLTLPRAVQRIMTRHNNPLRIHQALMLVPLNNSSKQIKLAKQIADSGATANMPEADARELIREARGESRLDLGDPDPKPEKKERESHKIKDEIDEPRVDANTSKTKVEESVTPPETVESTARGNEAESIENTLEDDGEPVNVEIGEVLIEGVLKFDDGCVYLPGAKVHVVVAEDDDGDAVWEEFKREKMLLDMAPEDISQLQSKLEAPEPVTA